MEAFSERRKRPLEKSDGALAPIGLRHDDAARRANTADIPKAMAEVERACRA